MVKRCPNCDEYAYSTRFKDSPDMFCRACGFFRDLLLDEEKMLADDELSRLREKYPLHGYPLAPKDADPSLWSDGKTKT